MRSCALAIPRFIFPRSAGRLRSMHPLTVSKPFKNIQLVAVFNFALGAVTGKQKFVGFIGTAHRSRSVVMPRGFCFVKQTGELIHTPFAVSRKLVGMSGTVVLFMQIISTSWTLTRIFLALFSTRLGINCTDTQAKK